MRFKKIITTATLIFTLLASNPSQSDIRDLTDDFYKMVEKVSTWVKQNPIDATVFALGVYLGPKELSSHYLVRNPLTSGLALGAAMYIAERLKTDKPNTPIVIDDGLGAMAFLVAARNFDTVRGYVASLDGRLLTGDTMLDALSLGASIGISLVVKNVASTYINKK